MIAAWMAALVLLGGALCAYLAAPHQALLPGVVRPRRLLRTGGGALLVLALILLLTIQGPATAIFTWATGAMLVWSIAPVAIRWWRFRRESTR
jgi:hypothetical protein